VLLSGGLDSAALTAWQRPAAALFVDYGQRPAEGELAAARAVSQALKVPLNVVRIESSALGSGLLAGTSPVPAAPTPEWWPFRNQLLVTVAGAWGIDKGVDRILVGCVVTDSERHVDGSAEFYQALDRLISMQEAGIRVSTPAIGMSSAELVTTSGIPDAILAWTHSCHVSPLACGTCPGCEKRASVLKDLGRLQ
jgi:7-cyano-7-deazaguanine synthase